MSLESTVLIEKDKIGRFRKDNDDGLRPEARRQETSAHGGEGERIISSLGANKEGGGG